MITRMLDAFQAVFEGKIYRHRVGNQGDQLAIELYEDLYATGLSPKFVKHIDEIRRGISVANVRSGISVRRGDVLLAHSFLGRKPSRLRIQCPARARRHFGYRY